MYVRARVCALAGACAHVRFRVSCKSVHFFLNRIMSVSSANKTHFTTSETLHISLM